MPAGTTYTPIARTLLTANAASVTFSSLPQTYTDLVLVISSADSAGANNQISFRLNSVSTTDYSWTAMYGNGTSAASNREATAIRTYGTLAWNTAQNTTLGTSMTIANFMRYANATTKKTVLSRSGNTVNGSEVIVSMWSSTAAITSIDLYSATTSRFFAAGSTFILYGIAAA